MQYIWRAHEPTLAAVLVDDGSVRFDRAVRPRNTKLSQAKVTGQRATKAPAPVELGPGSFVCDIDNLLCEGYARSPRGRGHGMLNRRLTLPLLHVRRNSAGLLAASRCVVLELDHEDLMRFFSRNPGVLLCVLHTNYVV